MQKLIDEIVNDLISLDPEFAGMEEDLRKLVQKLLAAKPDVEIDEAFKKRLQNELREKAEKLKIKPEDDSVTTKISNPFVMQKFAYSFAGAALAVLVLFTFQQFGGAERFVMNAADDAAPKMGIEKVGSQAFGSLAREESGELAVGKGGGGGDSEEVMSGAMVPPEYTVNKFVYNGNLDLPLGAIEVLKRTKGDIATSSLVNSLGRFDLDLVNLAALQDAKLQNFNIAEDREFGYMVMVDLAQGSVSVNQNWQKWPDPYRDCDHQSEPNCYESLRLSESDMLAESEVLSIAAKFVQQIGINLEDYGEPKISSNWREELARFGGEDFYYPESISVTYPLRVQDQLVYNQSGNEEGINVAVDQRNKKVSGVWGMQTQSYQASEYTAVADEALFRKFIEKGGLWGYLSESATNIREIPLGDPEMILMKHWQHTDGESQELIVPALHFPILEPPTEGYFYQKAVVIPLVEDILREQERNIPTPEPFLLEAEIDDLSGGGGVGLANPASVKCEADGYTLEIIKDEDGNESGFCKNLEDKGCEEWEYFRGECEIPAVG
jgi:hypothetical protein